MSRTLSIIGIVFTAIYLGVLWFFFDGRFVEITLMKPNEIGDLLAGIFGPLAILWLILGFFQQGIELRQNTEALRLQASELKRSVEQQEQLAESSRLQVESQQAILKNQKMLTRPDFIFLNYKSETAKQAQPFSFLVKNQGATATGVFFSGKPGVEFDSSGNHAFWLSGEEKWVDFVCHESSDNKFSVLIGYVDAAGEKGGQIFKFKYTFSSSAAEAHLIFEEKSFF